MYEVYELNLAKKNDTSCDAPKNPVSMTHATQADSSSATEYSPISRIIQEVNHYISILFLLYIPTIFLNTKTNDNDIK